MLRAVITSRDADIGAPFVSISPHSDTGLLDLLVGDPAALGAPRLLAAELDEHVSPAEELLGALLVEDDARVDGVVDRERHAVVDVGADEARDDVSGGALRGHDQVDARGAAELGRRAA